MVASSRPLPADPSRVGKVIAVPLDDFLVDERVKVTGYRRDVLDFVNLEEAEMVIAGGRGMKKAEHFDLLRDLADATQLTVYTQDDPDFPGDPAAIHDVDLAISWHHDIETVPTLIKVVDGEEVAFS